MTGTEATPAPLSGIHVLDLGRVISGPFVGQILGDLGATVTKIERLGVGDETRAYGGGTPSGGSSLFAALNRNKRSVAMDLSNPTGQDVMRRLLGRADVLVHNFRPGVAERLGLGPEDVWATNPRVVYCGISGFGATGPKRTTAANDVIAQAFAGLMSFTGAADGPPIRVPVPVADYTAGLFATAGVLAALVQRAATGRGRLVETSLLEGMLALESMHLGDYLTGGTLPVRLATGNMLGQPNQAFPTSDGSVVIAAVNSAMWRRCATALSGPELAADERYATDADRLARKDELAEVIEKLTVGWTTAELVALLGEAGVVCGPINDLAAVAADPQVHALGILQAPPGSAGPAEMVGSPLSVDGDRPVPRRRAPALGDDATAVLREAGLTDAEIETAHTSGAVARPHR
jgi:crotonobetainyl-CoA:carnitine CoA-transferase CaiB-like acyl-CoA transferase